ncbi:hypothetical protein, partial [Klebsiella pneumoniae]|uniref:hypothetical protein n=1 Tax=Klebsiella pneumoniae TaxID=573 RepID=UPI0039684C90
AREKIVTGSMNQRVATATEEQTAVVDSLNMDITEINTLNQEGVENLQATLRVCGALGSHAGLLRILGPGHYSFARP